MTLSLACLNVLGIAGHISEELKAVIHYYDWFITVATIALVFLLIGSIDRKIRIDEIKDCNVVFWCGWLSCFVSMGISSLFHPTRDVYTLWFILSLSIFPMILIIWQKRGELQKLFALIAHNMVLASYFFLIINIISVAFITNNYYVEGLEHEYLGIAPNPNSNGMIVLPFFTSALYLIITNQKNKLFYFFSLTISIMFAFISNTRTAELAMLCEVILALIIIFKHKTNYKLIIPSIRTIISGFVVILITITIGYCLMYIDVVDLKAYAAGEMEEATAEVYADESLIRINTLSSGRLILWKAFLKTVTFTGHGSPTGPVFEGYEVSRWAHNNALDIWYVSGLIAFMGYIIWLLAAWGFVIKALAKEGGFRKEYLLTVLAFVGYFVEAMLEITIYPMQTGIALLCFLTLTPIAFKEQAGTPQYEHRKELAYPDGGHHYK